MYKNFDIVIGGSGLTGITSALALSKIGYKIALVDPKPFESFLKGNYDNRTTALSYQTSSFYEEIDAWKGIQKFTCPINNILVEEPTSNAHAFLNNPEDRKNILGYMIQNKNLFKVLLEKVKKNKNITKFDNQIMSFKRSENEIIINLGSSTLSASLLIAADGKNSHIRRKSDIKSFRKKYNQKAFIFNIKHKNSHNNLAIENFLEQGPLASLPLNISKTNTYSSIVWSCNHPYYYQFKNNQKIFLEKFLKTNLNKCYGKVEIVSPINHWDLTLTNSKKYFDYRILLIGDSAHNIHPIAGQGFNLTLRGLKKFYLIAKNNYKKKGDLGDIKNLINYNNSHYLDAKLLILATDKLNLLFSNNNTGLRFIRKNGIRIFNQGRVFKNIFKNYASKGKLSLN